MAPRCFEFLLSARVSLLEPSVIVDRVIMTLVNVGVYETLFDFEWLLSDVDLELSSRGFSVPPNMLYR
jgi:hypothetical protein